MCESLLVELMSRHTRTVLGQQLLTAMQNTMNGIVRIALCGLAIVVTAGCEQEFNPKGEYRQQLVVYSVLSTRSDSQFVRVYTTYNPSGYNPLDNTSDTQVPSAQVVLRVDASNVTLSPVVVPRSDRSRYPDNIQGYLAFPYVAPLGKACSLYVTSEKGNVEAVTIVPAKGEIVSYNQYVLKAPDKYNENIAARIRISASAQGYLARLYIEFETHTGTSVVRHLEEVPAIAFTGGDTSKKFQYPMLVKKNLSTFEVYERLEFSLEVYKTFLADLKSRYGEVNVTRALYVLTQVDANLYTYYSVVNGFLDPYSIRTDLPDFTNITGGVGLFGAMVEDSLYVDLH